MFEKLYDSDNGLVITMNWLTDCLFLSMLWLLFSVFLIPFGPATAALYDTAYRTFRKKERVVYRRFFSSMKKNLRVGIPAGLLFLGLVFGGVKLWDALGALAAGGSSTAYAALWGYFVLLLLLLGLGGLMFPLLSRFETGLGTLLKNTVLLGIGNLPKTAAISLLTAVALWLCTWLWFPVIFVPALWAVVASFFIEPVFAPFLPEEEEDAFEENL